MKPQRARAYPNQLDDEIRRRRQKVEERTQQLDDSEARFRDVIERNADAIVVAGDIGETEEGIARILELENQVEALRSRVSELNAELEAVPAPTPSGSTRCGRLHDRNAPFMCPPAPFMTEMRPS